MASSNNGSTAAFVVQVGINYRGTSSELGGCINDVDNVWRLLQAERMDVKQRWLLTDDTEVKPTLANIQKAMREVHMALQASPAKFKYLLFQYSGHGTQVPDASGDEADRKDEAIVPLDYTEKGVLTDDALAAWLKTLPSCDATLLFDCCNSGTCMDLTSVGDAWRGIFLSGCMDPQTSADASIAGQQQGAMTSCLLRALAKTRDADAVKYWLDRFIREGSFTQRPVMVCNGQSRFFDGWPRA